MSTLSTDFNVWRSRNSDFCRAIQIFVAQFKILGIDGLDTYNDISMSRHIDGLCYLTYTSYEYEGTYEDGIF